MKRLCGSIVVGALVTLAASTAVQAQRPFIFAGGGASLPVGDFGDFAKTGWIATAGFGVPVGTQGISLGVSGFYGSNDHDVPAGTSDKTNLLSGLGEIGYSFSPEAKVSPYVVGGAGFLRHTFDPATGSNVSETKFAYSGAVGLGIRLGAKAGLWVEGRFLGSGDTKLVPVMAGFFVEL